MKAGPTVTDAQAIAAGFTVRYLAEQRGAITYDAALPQQWVDQCMEQGFDPRGRFVVCYDNSVMGNLLPLTIDAARDIPAALIW